MDALNLLKREHDEVKQLFEKIEKTESPKEAQELFTRIDHALTLHEAMEETHLYPALKKEPSTEDLTLESYQEHHVMDVLLGEIRRLKPTAEEWRPKVKVLQENVEHHVEEEEGELFPKVRKIWDQARIDEVGRKMAEMKEQRQQQQRAA